VVQVPLVPQKTAANGYQIGDGKIEKSPFKFAHLREFKDINKKARKCGKDTQNKGDKIDFVDFEEVIFGAVENKTNEKTATQSHKEIGEIELMAKKMKAHGSKKNTANGANNKT
jgi:hypothetical protein